MEDKAESAHIAMLQFITKTLLLGIFFSALFPTVQSKPYTVVIDPGHGGGMTVGLNDGSQRSHGASHNNATAPDGAEEKVLTLTYGKALQHALTQRGVRAVLTRKEDRSMSAMMRAALAVEVQADVFLSLHFNANSAGTGKKNTSLPSGPRAYIVSSNHLQWEYFHFTNPYQERDVALAELLVTSLEKAFAPFGGKPSETKVFHDTRLPTKKGTLGLGNLKDGIRSIGYARMDTHLYNSAVVLLEIEFLDNPAVTHWLLGPQRDTVMNRAAGFLADALLRWKKTAPRYHVTNPLKAPGR